MPQLAKLLCAFAAFLLVLMPTLDSAAKSLANDRHPSPAGQLLRAFDVVDDALDHLGTAPQGQQHQIRLPQALPPAWDWAPPATERPQSWPPEADNRLQSSDLASPDRPPRT